MTVIFFFPFSYRWSRLSRTASGLHCRGRGGGNKLSGQRIQGSVCRGLRGREVGVNTTHCVTARPQGSGSDPRRVYLRRRRSRGADNRSLDSRGRRGGQEVSGQDVQSVTGVHGGLQEQEKERGLSFSDLSIRPSGPELGATF